MSGFSVAGVCADEGDDEVENPDEQTDADQAAVASKHAAAANVERLCELGIHVRWVELDLGMDLLELGDELAEVAYVGDAFCADDRLPIVEIEHQHELAGIGVAWREDHALHTREGHLCGLMLLQMDDAEGV